MKLPIKAVLVGCGAMAGHWTKCVRELPALQLVGCVDLNLEAAQKRAAEFETNPPIAGTDLATLLKQTKPDVVFDCTVPAAHVKVTLTALKHGCHILGEKPLADSMANARKMVAAAKKAKRLYAVIQNRRYDPNIRRLKSFLESGAIGNITAVHSDYFMGPHFGGFRDRMKHSLLLDMAIHTFDAARLISGANARAVYCHEWNPKGSWWDHGPSAIAIFEMDHGIVYNYRGSWAAEGLNTTWESEWRIIGDKGSIRWNGVDQFSAETVSKPAKSGEFHSELNSVDWPAHDAGEKTGGHLGVIREFVKCLQTGQKPETICTDNIHSLAMVFGAIESAQKKQRVSLRRA